MFNASWPRCARGVRKSARRRLGAELLEDRRLLAAVLTPAAVEAMSLAMAVQASTPTPAMALPGSAASAADAQGLISNAYRTLLGRNPTNSDLQYWEGFFTANNAPTQSTGAGGVGTALTGVPTNGYTLSEYLGNTGANGPVPLAPTSGTGIGTREFDFGAGAGSSEMAYADGAGPFTTGNNDGISGGSPGGTLPLTPVSSQAGAESVNMATVQSQNATTSQFVQDILASPEYRHRVVDQVFTDFLHRAPSGNDLAYWGAQLGASGERNVLVDVLSSPEYYHDAGGTDVGYVDALYRDVLGRSPSTGDNDFWVSQLAAAGDGDGARAAVAADILGSPEASRLLITNSTGDALARLTGGGFDQQLFHGGLAAAAQESYAASLGGNRAFESVLESMVAANQSNMYQMGPSPLEDPGWPSTSLGATSA